MNKIYKVVWSKARQSYVVVSELAKRHGKASSRSILRVAMATALSMSFFGGQAVFAADSTVTGTEVTDSSMALGPNSIAKGNGAIATGSNTAAIGKGAVATGNNMTAEELQDLLNKKKTYETNLQNAQDAADASQQAYNKARSEYEEADVNNGIVDRANETIKGYQAQIDSTLKPNADTADAAYTKAKDDYDTLYNDFQNRISTIKTLDFTLYQDGSAAGYDLDKMATDLKTKTETGTSFNEPVDFYKGYIQNYIKAEGDLRQNKILAKDLMDTNYNEVIHDSYSSSSIRKTALYSTRVKAENLSKLGLTGNVDLKVLAKPSMYRDTVNQYYYTSADTFVKIPAHDWVITDSYDDTKVLNDDDYNKSITDLNTSMSSVETSEKITSDLTAASQYFSQFNPAYAISADALNKIATLYDTNKDWYSKGQKALYDAYHYQYLYENETNQTKKLKYLSAKEKALVDFNKYKGLLSDGQSQYSSYLMGYSNDIASDITTRAKDWYKTNITDVEDATKVSLKSLQDGLDAEIQNKKKAMDDALTAKNTADQALSDMEQKIKDTQPTAEQLAEAAKYADKKKAMDDAAAKLEADKEALEKAQKDLSSLADLTHIGENAIAYGTDALVSGADAIGIGTDAIVTGTNAIGMGKGTVASGENATAVGQGSSVSGASATALGSSNTVTGDSSTAVGNGHTVLGAKSGAFGSPSNIYGDGSYSFGNNNTIGAIDSTTNKAVANQGLNTFVLGSDITTTANNAVILGAGSTDGGNNTVSVGSAKQTRRLVNVGDARLNATSTDAVTGRQLYTTNQNIAGFAADIKSNTSTISDLSKSVSSALDSVSSMSESFSSINDLKADASLNNLSAAGKQVISNAAKEAVQSYVKSLNSTSAAKANTATTTTLAVSKLAVSPALSRMALSTSLLAADGTSTADEDSNDNEMHEDFFTGKDLTFSDADWKLSVDSSKGAVAAGNTHVVNGGTVYTALNAEQEAREAADTALDTKIGTTVDGDYVKAADSVGTNLGTLDTQVKANADAITKKADKDAVDTALATKASTDASNIDADAFSKKLGTGTVTNGSTGLVTGDTVYQAIQKTDSGKIQSDGKIMTLGKADSAAVLDVSGTSGARVVTGVATDPADVTSAANVGYVNQSAAGLHNEIQGVQQSLTNDIKKVGAGAAALAGLHPQDYDPQDKWDFAVGYGNYRGQNASAVAAYYHPNEDTLINVGTTLGNGNNMVTAGVSFKFGPGGDTHTMSRAALTAENQALKKDVMTLNQGMSELHAENVSLSKKNASLEKDLDDLKSLVTELKNQIKK